MGLAQPSPVSGGLGRGPRFVGYASVLAFVVLLGASMMLYPGGTWTDTGTTSYRFFENFFCDLTHETGLNGLPNRGAIYAKAALVAMAPGLFVFYLALSRSFAEGASKRTSAVRGMGTLSAMALVFVPLTPSDHFAALHTVASLAASVAGLVALSVYAVGSGGSLRRGWPAFGLLAIVSIDVVLYVQQVRTNGPTPILLPALQKVAALWLLAWMLALFRPRSA